jgi:hypothetical protein
MMRIAKVEEMPGNNPKLGSVGGLWRIAIYELDGGGEYTERFINYQAENLTWAEANSLADDLQRKFSNLVASANL